MYRKPFQLKKKDQTAAMTPQLMPQKSSYVRRWHLGIQETTLLLKRQKQGGSGQRTASFVAAEC